MALVRSLFSWHCTFIKELQVPIMLVRMEKPLSADAEWNIHKISIIFLVRKKERKKSLISGETTCVFFLLFLAAAQTLT